MLQKTHKDVAFCHDRAAQARCMAESETDPVRKQEYVDMEIRWFNLAMSYEFAERYNAFTDDIIRRLDKLRAP